MSEAAAAVLVLNAGSSSIKAALDTGDGAPLRAQADLRDGQTQLTITAAQESPQSQLLPATDGDRWQQAIAALLDALCGSQAEPPFAAVGHRIVHGGRFYAEPVAITPEVLTRLDSLAPLAPLHQPHGLAGIEAITQRFCSIPQVACFDTAFHRTCPDVARRCALPRSWHDLGIERYGFHGLSYQSIVEQLPGVAGSLPRRLVIAHLGAGASMAAVLDGRTLEGLRASRRLQQRCQRLRQWLDRLRQTPGAAGGPALETLAEGERLALQRQLEDDLPALLLHLDPETARLAMGRWRDPEDRLFHPRPPLDGSRLQQLLAIAPGPRLGQLIDHLTAERAFGRLGKTAATDTAALADRRLTEEAIAAAQAWLGRQGEAGEADPRRD